MIASIPYVILRKIYQTRLRKETMRPGERTRITKRRLTSLGQSDLTPHVDTGRISFSKLLNPVRTYLCARGAAESKMQMF